MLRIIKRNSLTEKIQNVMAAFLLCLRSGASNTLPASHLLCQSAVLHDLLRFNIITYVLIFFNHHQHSLDKMLIFIWPAYCIPRWNVVPWGKWVGQHRKNQQNSFWCSWIKETNDKLCRFYKLTIEKNINRRKSLLKMYN